MADPSSASFVDASGAKNEVTLRVEDYRAAADHKLSLTQYYAQKYPTAANSASALEQFAFSAGIRVKPDHRRGIPASNLADVMYGVMDKTSGTIVRSSGDDRQTTAGRILFPEIMMQMVNEVLMTDKDDILTPWESAIAVKTSVVGPRVDQPLINTTAPEASASQTVAQLALPPVMVTITLAERSYTIPTKGIALEVSDQAQQSATIDLVALSLASQARGERIRRIEEDMVNIISGDTDLNIAPVTFANASTFDAALGADQITHRAFLKWLRSDYQRKTITHILSDIDALIDVENRTGKPTQYTDQTRLGERLPVSYTVENSNIPTPTFLILPTEVVGADQLVGFDRRFAMQQITNIAAAYSAVESFVLRRATAMRFDYGTAVFKLMNDAFTGLTLGA